MDTDNVDDQDGFHVPYLNPIKEAQWTRRRNLAGMLSQVSRRYHKSRKTAVSALVAVFLLSLLSLGNYWYWGEIGAGTINLLALTVMAGLAYLYSSGEASAGKREVNRIAEDIRDANYKVTWFVSIFDGMASAKLEDLIPWPD